MSTEHPHSEPAAEDHAAEERASAGEAASGEGQAAADESDPRYASQEAAAEPAPVAFEGGAGAPDGGVTPRREWIFLVLAVFFSVVLVSVPAALFTAIDLTAPTGEDGASAPEGSEPAGEQERRQLLQETRADALSKLYTYGPTEDGAYRIPVEHAMRLTLQEAYGANAASTDPSYPLGEQPARGTQLPQAAPGDASPAEEGAGTPSDTTALR